MSEPEPSPKSSRRDQAIAHAADLLREGGPLALTSVAVAGRMGITQSAVYRHVRNMDELSALASELVVAEVSRSLRDLMFDTAMDWDAIDDVGRLCRDLVEHVVNNQRSLEVVARWRFVEGELGVGIREVIEQGCDRIAVLLETRWRSDFAYRAPLDERERAAVAAHARVVHDDVHAVARLAYSPSLEPLVLADVAVLMQHRIIAGWASFVIDMNDRVGLAFPRIDLQQGIVSD